VLGIADTVAARHISDLAEMDRTKEEGSGLDLIYQKINPRDRRTRKLSLTPQGKAFRTKLIRRLSKGRR
jgi:DNA-binding MarR family transcriptional regulator